MIEYGLYIKLNCNPNLIPIMSIYYIYTHTNDSHHFFGKILATSAKERHHGAAELRFPSQSGADGHGAGGASLRMSRRLGERQDPDLGEQLRETLPELREGAKNVEKCRNNRVSTLGGICGSENVQFFLPGMIFLCQFCSCFNGVCSRFAVLFSRDRNDQHGVWVNLVNIWWCGWGNKHLTSHELARFPGRFQCRTAFLRVLLQSSKLRQKISEHRPSQGFQFRFLNQELLEKYRNRQVLEVWDGLQLRDTL